MKIEINKTLWSDYWKWKKNTESINPRVLKTRMVKQYYYQYVLYVVVKNKDLWKDKKQKEY